MTIKEAMEWLNQDTREKKMDEIEDTNGVDTVSIIISKFNEACIVACEIMETVLKKGLD